MTSFATEVLCIPEEQDPDRDRARAAGSSTGFVLLLIVNALLLIRPADLIPGLEGMPIFEVAILLCLLVSAPCLVPQLNWKVLQRRPCTVLIFGILVAVILSNLSHGKTWEARMGGIEFAKLVIFYVLVTGLVDSKARLRIFVSCIILCILVDVTLAMLVHHGVLDIEAMTEVQQWEGTPDASGNREYLLRLLGPGIFHDPNDFCLILVTGILLAGKFAFEAGAWVRRILWIAIICAFGYAAFLTRSRGGFLSLSAGLATFCIARFGWKRSIFLSLVLFPALIFMFAGRQTEFDISDRRDTAQTRILIWRDDVVLFHGAPLFGIGYGGLGEVAEQVSHNSFIHAYTELGLLGGTFFVGIFYFLISGVWQRNGASCDSELDSWRPFLFAMTVAYCVGTFSLSRNYVASTYLIVALSAIYLALKDSISPSRFSSINPSLLKGIAVASLFVLIGLHLAVKIFAV